VSRIDIAALPAPPAWIDDALCAQTDPETWFPGKGENATKAKRVCATCDVRLACLDWALSFPDAHDLYGVYGGLTVIERRKLRKRAAA